MPTFRPAVNVNSRVPPEQRSAMRFWLHQGPGIPPPLVFCSFSSSTDRGGAAAGPSCPRKAKRPGCTPGRFAPVTTWAREETIHV